MNKMKNIVTSKYFLLILLIIAGFGIYAFNLHNPLFWDDDDWIINNSFVHDFSRLKEIFTRNILAGFGLNSNYYRPFLLLTFALNYIISGIKPLGYHLVSNGFHIANGLLVFSILYFALKKKLPAFVAALLFLIHPLQTEAVTYISGRGDPMSVFFMLLALWLFIKRENLGNSRTSKYWLLSISSLFSMILAVLSRETAILLPALILIFYIAFLSKDRLFVSVKTAFAKTIPFWTISGFYWFLRMTVLNFNNTLNFYSQVNDYTGHLSYRLYTFGYALVEYFKLIFVPLGLHMERDLAIRTSILQWPVWLAVLIIAGIICAGWYFFKKRKQQSIRVWFFSWAWFFIALAPVSGIIPINAVMYEHWLYLPLIGFFALAGCCIGKALEIAKIKTNFGYRFLILGLIVYFSFFATASAKRNLAWGGPIKFYEDILRYNPNSVRIMNNLGNLYSAKKNYDKAIEFYEKAAAGPNGNIFAQPHYNLANIYAAKGDIRKAIVGYKKAVEADPNFPFAYQNLAVIYAGQGELAEAQKMLERVIELRPFEPEIYYNLALVFLAQKNNDLALQILEKGLKYAKGNNAATAEIMRLLGKLK